MRTFFASLSLIIFPLSLSAQSTVTSPDPRQAEIVKQKGNLFSLEFVHGEPSRLYVVGKEEAKLDLSKMKITVRRVKPYPGKVLSTDLNHDHFVISEPIDSEKPTVLEVTTKVKDKTETIHLNLDVKKKP
jgi:hypothetical protein